MKITKAREASQPEFRKLRHSIFLTHHQQRNSTAVIQIMSPILQKIFMLQRHQLIRWGKFSGYATLVTGIFSILTAIFCFIWMTAKMTHLESKTSEGRRQERQIAQSLDSIEKLRSFAIENSEYFEKMESVGMQTI